MATDRVGIVDFTGAAIALFGFLGVVTAVTGFFTLPNHDSFLGSGALLFYLFLAVFSLGGIGVGIWLLSRHGSRNPLEFSPLQQRVVSLAGWSFTLSLPPVSTEVDVVVGLHSRTSTAGRRAQQHAHSEGA